MEEHRAARGAERQIAKFIQVGEDQEAIRRVVSSSWHLLLQVGHTLHRVEGSAGGQVTLPIPPR